MGWIPDAEDPRDVPLTDRDFGALRMQPAATPGAGPPPWSATCSPLMPPVMDQGGDESCVAQAVAALVWAAHVRAGVADRERDLLSRKALWWLSRFERGVQGLNMGQQIRTAFRILNGLGYCREKWHSHGRRYDEAPTPQAARMSHDQRTRGDGRVEYRAIHGGLDEVKAAIAAGLPVMGGWYVGRDFCRGDFDAREPVGPPSDPVGGHAMVLHAYEGDDFLARSSWGDWGDSGSAWMRADYAAQGVDFWTVVRAPRFSDEVRP